MHLLIPAIKVIMSKFVAKSRFEGRESRQAMATGRRRGGGCAAVGWGAILLSVVKLSHPGRLTAKYGL